MNVCRAALIIGLALPLGITSAFAASPRYWDSGASNGWNTSHARGHWQRDNVGSLAQTPNGRIYNRVSGQTYSSCVFDEGYGRVRPCDAGSR
jgi:hypothetical protein